ncbi:MAG: HEAT repeat domain-containing protein [Gemmatimonadales bacterium]
MTAGTPRTEILPASQVAELIQGVVKALRAFHMYLPNNPIYQRSTDNLRVAFRPIWAATDALVLTVVETDFVWEDQVVYHQLNKSESLAWGLFKDGMRALTIRQGAEEEEFPRFLEVINRARYLAADAGDDLLTLLWAEEFEFIEYRFIEFSGEGGGALPEQTGTYNAQGGGEGPGSGGAEAEARERRARAAEESPPRPKGVVALDDFDSTLYFLEESEINYIAREVDEEYRRDVRGAALSALFDILEVHGDGPTRTEILGVLEQLFPNFLNARDFRIAATVLRESKTIASRATALETEQAERLERFVTKLSEPAIVSQLLQSLDEAPALAGEPDVAELLKELRSSALEPVLTWIPNLSSAPLRALLEKIADRLAETNGAEVLRILRDPQSEALASVVALCGRLNLTQAIPGLSDTAVHPDPVVRLATVQVLAQLGTPSALALVDKAIDDADRGVRIAAVRVAGGRGYKGALRRVEAVVLGKTIKEMDLTEKMAFFEAYGAIAGPSGLNPMSGLLLSRGLLKLKQSSETRACAAIALGRIRTAEARQVLERAADDKDLVVRNAVSRALRESGA